MHLRPRLIILLTLAVWGTMLHAQKDTLPPGIGEDDEFQQQLIEDVLANTEDETDEFSFNAAFDLLETYRRRPLNINKATYEELEETLLLSPIQIGQLIDYRDRMGGLLSVYELQVIPGMDMESVRRLAQFVRVGGDLDDAKIPLGRMLAEGDRELYVRWQRRLETARGYELGPEDGTSYYLGSPDRIYTRFRQRYSKNLSFGITAEKDPGEAFFAENNKKRGFDFYSAHFFLGNVNRTVKAVALGDFAVSFGQGLILYTGFGFGKSSQTTNVARGGPVLRPYTSVNEASFMRGAGTTLAFGDKLELSVFGSRKGRTANLITVTDTLDVEAEDLGVTSLNISGLNRTPNEVEDRNSITEINYGGSLRYRANQRLQVGLNVLGTNLSQPLNLNDQAYNRFFFQGTDLLNASLDYRYRYRNFTFFGELAGSDNGGVAQIHGLMMGLDRFVDVSLVYRNYGVDYQALNARPFGETSGGRNENGMYLGLELRPGKHWRVNAYYDVFRFPYLRFNIDAPSEGHEYRFRVTYWQKRKLETYLELRSETKGFGTDGDESVFTNLDPVVPRTRFQARLHFGYKINSFLEWRSRIDAGFTDDELNGREKGFMVYQDLHYRPRGAFSFSTRMAFFDTDGFNVRFYQYENGLLYNARVVPYYNRGTRAFFLVRYKGIRGLTLEGRIAQTFYTDGTVAGSGLEETGLPRRTEMGAQAIWRF
ncbi:helix-hairpin-helix domain-containing protein [Neolewinella aurantiaca]|uniref:Helix-hairpin-helix domain-containing protein n=2 Tax=Neolewinella aurantiaca TaxID=2602767 RepID=A0A5C7FYJ7_9BACT|nr:helix-hairpin-helix domain-containing protein [Neolewinella aurantiaca]